MRYYFIAGERSGDLHAGNLARAIKKYDASATMRAFGGAYLQEAGADIAIDYKEVAVMGFWEVLTSLRKVSRYLDRCKQDIIAYRPDVVILVDYGGFNKRIASWAKSKGIKVYYYISPKVWAWNQNRAWKLKATVDKMFVILPFEKDFFQRFEWNVDYVGNPVLDAVKAHVADTNFRSKNKLSDAPVIALLPGSRKQELQGVIPVFAEVVKRRPSLQFALAAIQDLPRELYSPLDTLPNVTFVYEDTYNLLLNAEGAIVTSGTATLETALFNVPQVVVYKTSAFTYWIAKRIIRVPYISLVNLIANREVVRELIQDEFNPETLAKELDDVLSAKRQQILQGYTEIFNLLDTGSASENAAKLMVQYLQAED